MLDRRIAVDSLLDIMRALVFILTFLASWTSVSAIDPPQQSDAEIRQKIAGTWIIDLGTTKTNGPYLFSARGTVTYSTNGSYVVRARVSEDAKVHDERFEGFWHVKDGILTDTVTNYVGTWLANPKNYEVARVIKVDESELILESGKKIKIREVEKRSR
jgi:hypothetical protein